MFKRSVAAAIAVAAFSSLLLVAAVPSPAQAADIELLGPVSLRVVLPGLLPQFEESSGHKITVGYATLGAITKRLVEGEAVDVAMVSPEQNEELQKRGKLMAGSRAEIARVGFTVFVRKGAPKPDVGSVDALKLALLAAKSIVLGDPAAGGGAGVYTAGLMERLGLAADIKARTKLVKSGTEVAEAVAKGEAEIGIGVASDAAIVPGLDAFPLPTGAQSYSVYVAGVSSGSKQVDAAKALIVFLTSPASKQALKANGFETP
ncbi:extracellular solute-binding protein [Bradyrhizobium sp. AUGA SZCCT0431]|uniref:molybdate ABC transporter substrate-binding protein n=1 Tax=Bradyrhizobium sp. AUGA SZCCT0431 TaxID=2807674 RepID=UPI001BA45F4D|nr:substrate-binding domain-containing protein [Bradyrhizobium sp. AUGA SZCCT0431]MBR1147044.1 substrate-binding domain-containing protein [Bradyrhizobium sp. AUGA SZCCT0431]